MAELVAMQVQCGSLGLLSFGVHGDSTKHNSASSAQLRSFINHLQLTYLCGSVCRDYIVPGAIEFLTQRYKLSDRRYAQPDYSDPEWVTGFFLEHLRTYPNLREDHRWMITGIMGMQLELAASQLGILETERVFHDLDRLVPRDELSIMAVGFGA